MQFKKYILVPAIKKSGTTALWLLKMILPISLAVRFLDYFGILTYIAGFLDPVFMNLGLPGSTAIIFITSIFLPLYAPLAIITSMSLTLRELTILALMCQIAHNLPVESAIQAKTGTSFWGMTTLRIVMSILTAFVLNLILPVEMGMPLFVQTDIVVINSIGELLLAWLKGSLNIAILIFVIIFSLNLLYNILNAYHLISKLSKGVEPLLKFFGLSANTGFLWLIGYIVGLAYGGALMMDQLKEGTVTRKEANLLNHHLAVSHSVIEDNLLFVALGVSIWWILGVRFTVAWFVVWFRRLILRMSSNNKVNYNAYF
ncbi:MAG: nucleoside recognition protein [Fermentimonas sp.]|nr:nucleoside recognition protein [Fermentimonas sp.]MDD4008878.1 nucleoside recognition protein [Fermentimonas sp.]MDD4697313.1 nucleoside recognition protein [Fermentimonas sp.]